MNPNATIATVALPSLEVLNSAAQTQERSAAGRSMEGMKRAYGNRRTSWRSCRGNGSCLASKTKMIRY